METELLKHIAMHNTVVAYVIYLIIMLSLTIWVARIIHKNTRPFLAEIFPQHEQVAVAVNNLLQMGFYLLALGYGFLKLKIKYSPSWFGSYEETIAKQFMTTHKEVIEELAIKLGGFTLFIGFLLFFNLMLMLILRKGKRNRPENPQFTQYIEGMNR